MFGSLFEWTGASPCGRIALVGHNANSYIE
jgi:hypothetical protein